ncbi:EpsG family protein [Vibrio sp. 1075]|uniref:EpsG family protein n=1 Tax=Vibrio sp. 1075 TaxID=3074543 RepID=UPI00296410CC|nr:EpsG family protein [Vibrio sp. 1075]MDW2309489.1 EpsG family protein [Vibrio sp. 1075]
MIVYLSLWFLLFFFSLLLLRNEGLYERIFFNIIFATILFVFIGFRDQVGGDWFNYENMFEAISYLPFFGSVVYTDPAYAAINFFVSKIGYSIHLVNTICALIFVLCIFLIANRTKFPVLFYFCIFPYLVVVVALGYTRQSAAIALFSLAIVYLLEQSQRKYWVCTLLAILFHKTAVVSILFLLMANNKNIKNHKFKLAFIGLPFILFFGYILSDKMLVMYELYFYGDIDSKGAFLRILILTIPSLLFFIYYKELKAHSRYDFRLLSFLAIAPLALLLLVFISSTMADRLSLYFYVVQALIFVAIIEVCEIRTRYISFFIISIFSFAQLYFWLSFSYWAVNYWLPYGTILL